MYSDEEQEGAQTYVWGTNVNVTDARQRFRRFLSNFEAADGEAGGAPHYVQKLRDIAQTEDYSLNLDCAHLHAYDAGLYKLLVLYPQEMIPIFDVEINDYFADEVLDREVDRFPQIQARPACCFAAHLILLLTRR